MILAKNDEAFCPKKDCRERTKMTITSEVKPAIRDIIKAWIRESNDSGLPEGSYWRSSGFMGKIDFSDFMDIVLYRISLDPDMERITLIKTYDFWGLIEETWKEWRKCLEKAWGYRKTKGPSVQYVGKRVPAFWDLDSAWASGSGPLGGTMGAAESYAFLHPGFTHHTYLLEFFRYPETLRDKGEYGNWPRYKLYRIEQQIFPKFRRKKHQKKLDIILDFAEEICVKLRERAKKTK